MSAQKLTTAVVAGIAVIFGTSATVEATSHDVAWTFGNVGSASYRLDAFEPEDAGLGASLGSEEPTLTVQIGKRYQVTVTNFVPHLFEVLAKGASAGADTVLPADFTTEPLPTGEVFDHQSIITEWTVDTVNPNIIDKNTHTLRS